MQVTNAINTCVFAFTDKYILKTFTHFYLFIGCCSQKFLMDMPTRLEFTKLYYANGQSPTACLRAYKKEHKLISDPYTLSDIKYLINKFETTYSLHDRKSSGRPSIINDDSIETVRNSLSLQSEQNNNSISSLREASRSTGISYTTVRKIAKEQLHYKKYKPSFVQQLHEDDAQHRLDFAQMFQNQLASRIGRILWTDEAHFHLYGEVSSINGYIWAAENPHIVVQKPLHSPKLTVAIAFTSNFILEPYFFNIGETIRKENYTDMVRNHIIPALKRKRAFSNTIFMQDGATPHTARLTLDFLASQFGDRLISRSCDYFWPARSPDLTPCDFWFWGYVKRKVYSRKIDDLATLRQVIVEEIANIDPEMLEKSVKSVTHRLADLQECGGHHLHC